MTGQAPTNEGAGVMPVRRALLSVWDKAGLAGFGRALAAREAALEFCELNSRRIRRRGWCHWRRRRRYGGWFYLCARTTREGRDVHIVV